MEGSKDPNLYDYAPIFEDDAPGCLTHNCKHFERIVTAQYTEWNRRILSFIPEKDCGPLRYFVDGETAPIPTQKSKKLSTCVKVQFDFFLILNLVLPDGFFFVFNLFLI